MKMRLLPIVVAALVGCGPPPSGGEVPAPSRSTVRVVGFQNAEFFNDPSSTSTTLGVEPARAWAALPAVYEELGIPVADSSERLMALGNPSFQTRRVGGERVSRYVDCGTTLRGEIANVYDVTLSVATRLTEAEGGGTRVVTVLDAWAEPRATSGNPVHCTSKRALEERIEEALVARVGGAP